MDLKKFKFRFCYLLKWKYLFIVFFLQILFFARILSASPDYLTLQSRIIQPDGHNLEAASVNYRFSITDPVGTCVVYQEDFSNVSMVDSKGLVAIKIGSGTRGYPVAATTMKDIFTNFNSPVFNCQAGGTYTAASSDQRKIVMQFNDGSGWQTVPSLEINSTPFSLESLSAQKLGLFPAGDYVRSAQFATCAGGEAVHFNGTNFTCVTLGGAATSVAAAAGLAGTPSISFSGDTNTGLYSGAADTISISNNGSNTFNITSMALSSTTTGGATITQTNGTAAAPTFSFAGDADTGWYRAAADTLAASTAGAERIRIDSSGNVGIGTAAPDGGGLLEVYKDLDGGEGATILLKNNHESAGSSVGIKFKTNFLANNTYQKGGISFVGVGGYGKGDIHFLNNGNDDNSNALPGSSTKMIIRSTGNVGIGTTTPAGTLDVQGGTAAASTNGGNISMTAQNAGVGGNNNGGSVVLISGTNTGTGVTGNITITTPASSSTNSGGDIILSASGYLSTSAGGYLALDGSSTNAGNAFLRAGDGHASNGTPGALNLRGGNAFFNTGGAVTITGGGGGSATGIGGDVSINGGAKQGAGIIGNVILQSTGGNVGIGTTAPAEKLEVNGAIRLGTTVAANAGTVRWDGTNFQGYNGSAWANFVPNPPASGACDTTNTYSTAGTYVYTVPAAFGSITIKVWGGGGGGGSTNVGSASSTGGSSSIVSLGLSAGGGSGAVGTGGGNNVYSAGGSGGIAIGGTINTNGANGATGAASFSGGGASASNGGSGGLAVTLNTAGQAGQSPGGGGSGAAYMNFAQYAGGGGAGAYIEKTFSSAQLLPGTAINDIVVGAGGGGAVGTTTGGTGGVGRVSIACSSVGTPIANDRSLLFINSGAYSTDVNFVYSVTGDVGIGTTSPQTKLQVEGIISPATNNTYTLGNASYRFTEVYATNGVINTSDRREKKDIYNTDLGLDFINKLRPVSYRWNTGVDKDVHYGLIAQEAEQALVESGKMETTSIVTHDEVTDRYGVRYSELISPLIKAFQELYDRFVTVDSEVATLKAKDAIKDREIASLKAENVTMKAENALMKTYLCSKDKNAPICK